MARGVLYAGGGGTLRDMLTMQARWDILRGVGYAGVGGTLRSVWNKQGR
jgi:hypothetical protein